MEAGRVGIEVVYGKEININPVAGMEGVSRGFRKKFGYFPGNYGQYPEPLPLPDWVFEGEPVHPVTGTSVPEDMARALEVLKAPMYQLLKDIEAIVNVWPDVYPVLNKYHIL